MQSVPITTKVVSSNSVHGEVYSIQHYVIKFVSELWWVGGIHRELCYDFTNSMYKFSIILSNVICGLTSTKIQTFTHNTLVHCPDQYNEIVTYHMLHMNTTNRV
jgi:hypothetical protein